MAIQNTAVPVQPKGRFGLGGPTSFLTGSQPFNPNMRDSEGSLPGFGQNMGLGGGIQNGAARGQLRGLVGGDPNNVVYGNTGGDSVGPMPLPPHLQATVDARNGGNVSRTG